MKCKIRFFNSATILLFATGCNLFGILGKGEFDVWTQQKAVVLNDLYSVTWGKGLFVATGQNGTIITSSDGRTWKSIYPITGEHLGNVVYSDDTFIAYGAKIKLTSYDGVTWTKTNGDFGNTRKTAYGNDSYVIVGNKGEISLLTKAVGATSYTSTKVDSATNKNLLSVIYAEERFVAVGDEGAIVTSANGKDWLNVSIAAQNDLYSVTYGNDFFIATGSDGAILVSASGTEWRAIKHKKPFWQTIYGSAYGNNCYVVVGDKGFVAINK